MYLLAVQSSVKGGKWERALSLMMEWRKLAAKEAISRQTELNRGSSFISFKRKSLGLGLRYSILVL